MFIVKAEREKGEKAWDKTTNHTTPDNATRSRRSAGGRSQGARKTIAEANAAKAQAERERDELREALDILEERFGSDMRPYDSEDGTRPSHVKKPTATPVLRSMSVNKTTQPQE